MVQLWLIAIIPGQLVWAISCMHVLSTAYDRPLLETMLLLDTRAQKDATLAAVHLAIYQLSSCFESQLCIIENIHTLWPDTS